MFLNISLEHAIDVFFYGVSALSILIGLVGFFLITKSTVSRVVLVVGLSFLAETVIGIGDVYVFHAFSMVATAPWAIYFFNAKKSDLKILSFYSFCGLFWSFCHFIRAFSWVSGFIFVFVLLFKSGYIKHNKKFVAMLLFAVCFFVPKLFYKSVFDKSNEFLSQQDCRVDDVEGHCLWHMACCGLGYLDNDYGYRYDDRIAKNNVYSKYQGVRYGDASYDQAARKYFFDFVLTKEGFFFYLRTTFAKIGVLLLYLIACANLGLLFALLFRKPFIFDWAFLAMIIFNSLFSILTVPIMPNVVGVISSSALFGIYSICFAFDGEKKYKVFKRVRDFLIYALKCIFLLN
ncbi:hypothetical protein HN511_00490 [bacterium]|nr:hypothetical protein [bacterium]